MLKAEPIDLLQILGRDRELFVSPGERRLRYHSGSLSEASRQTKVGASGAGGPQAGTGTAGGSASLCHKSHQGIVFCLAPFLPGTPPLLLKDAQLWLRTLFSLEKRR